MITLSTRAAAIAGIALTSITAMVTAGAIALAPTDSKHPDAAQTRSESAETMMVPATTQPSTVAPLSTGTAAAGYIGNETTTFIPVEPCRIADTRKGGGSITTGTTRDFIVTGIDGFETQGGVAGGCGIPENAVAVAAILKATAPSGTGYLKAWARGESIPSASALNYPKGLTIGDGTVVPLGDPYSSPGMSVRTYRTATQLAIDVTGYYVLDDHGLVDGEGTLLDGGATAWQITRESVGEYEIVVDHDIYSCAYLVTPQGYGTIASATWDDDFTNVFHVSLQDLNGASVDGVFFYDIEC